MALQPTSPVKIFFMHTASNNSKVITNFHVLLGNHAVGFLHFFILKTLFESVQLGLVIVNASMTKLKVLVVPFEW